MKTYVVAVSGGVDSVVLLDMFAKKTDSRIVVAHFDHGIRDDSDADARFVWMLAQTYKVPFEVRREELGADASEALARERRYIFLHDIATKYNATIVTAHHEDDVIETIAINISRGTGWRGLAVMDTASVVRPLLGMSKKTLYKYANKYHLEFLEDETNTSNKYLRNRLRKKLHQKLTQSDKKKLLDLRTSQQIVKKSIDAEVSRHTTASRYKFSMIDEVAALEVLKAMTSQQLTTPQLRSMLHMIKTARAGSTHQPGSGLRVLFSEKTFEIL